MIEWGISAVGSAPHWQCGGHGFKSRMLHQRIALKRFSVQGFFVYVCHFITCVLSEDILIQKFAKFLTFVIAYE